MGNLSKRERQLVERFPGRGGFLTRVYLPMNIMGGVAEAFGALLLHTVLGESVSVLAMRGAPHELTMQWCEDGDSAAATPATIDTRELRTAGGSWMSAADAIERFGRKLNVPCQALLGAYVEGQRQNLLTNPEAGYSVAALGFSGMATFSNAVTPLAAALLSSAGALDGAPPPEGRAASVAAAVQHDWLGWPLGWAEAHVALQPAAGGVHQFRSDIRAPSGWVGLAAPWELVGIDCGAESTEARQTNRRVRTAALMGCALVKRIIEHEQTDTRTWNGQLSGLSMTDYVEKYRDRLPTKLKGEEFLERFGDPDDPHAPIEPGFTYKVRSRTEHIIYEHARATHFVELVSRGARTSDQKAYADAGELMYASHWSYGQRCGMGSIETDYLVNQLRACGEKRDIFGAKVCGRGCGGMVAVLLRATPNGEEALAEACAAYEVKMKRTPRVMRTAPTAIELSPMAV